MMPVVNQERRLQLWGGDKGWSPTFSIKLRAVEISEHNLLAILDFTITPRGAKSQGLRGMSGVATHCIYSKGIAVLYLPTRLEHST